MESWIKENPITSILIGAVILLALFSGYQSNQINQLSNYISWLEAEDEVGLDRVSSNKFELLRLEREFRSHNREINPLTGVMIHHRH